MLPDMFNRYIWLLELIIAVRFYTQNEENVTKWFLQTPHVLGSCKHSTLRRKRIYLWSRGIKNWTRKILPNTENCSSLAFLHRGHWAVKRVQSVQSVLFKMWQNIPNYTPIKPFVFAFKLKCNNNESEWWNLPLSSPHFTTQKLNSAKGNMCSKVGERFFVSYCHGY